MPFSDDLRPPTGLRLTWVGTCALPWGGQAQPVSKAKRVRFLVVTLAVISMMFFAGRAVSEQVSPESFTAQFEGIAIAEFPNVGEVPRLTLLVDGDAPETPSSFGIHAVGVCRANGQKVIDHVASNTGRSFDNIAIRLSRVASNFGLVKKKQHWIWVYEMPGCKSYE
ncbi:MAG: hypothetical protein ACPGVA_07135 [Pikeienuella sp.]